mgnify:CR=1 FL=1
MWIYCNTCMLRMWFGGKVFSQGYSSMFKKPIRPQSTNPKHHQLKNPTTKTQTKTTTPKTPTSNLLITSPTKIQKWRRCLSVSGHSRSSFWHTQQFILRARSPFTPCWGWLTFGLNGLFIQCSTKSERCTTFILIHRRKKQNLHVHANTCGWSIQTDVCRK